MGICGSKTNHEVWEAYYDISQEMCVNATQKMFHSILLAHHTQIKQHKAETKKRLNRPDDPPSNTSTPTQTPSRLSLPSPTPFSHNPNQSHPLSSPPPLPSFVPPNTDPTVSEHTRSASQTPKLSTAPLLLPIAPPPPISLHKLPEIATIYQRSQEKFHKRMHKVVQDLFNHYSSKQGLITLQQLAAMFRDNVAFYMSKNHHQRIINAFCDKILQVTMETIEREVKRYGFLPKYDYYDILLERESYSTVFPKHAQSSPDPNSSFTSTTPSLSALHLSTPHHQSLHSEQNHMLGTIQENDDEVSRLPAPKLILTSTSTSGRPRGASMAVDAFHQFDPMDGNLLASPNGTPTGGSSANGANRGPRGGSRILYQDHAQEECILQQERINIQLRRNSQVMDQQMNQHPNTHSDEIIQVPLNFSGSFPNQGYTRFSPIMSPPHKPLNSTPESNSFLSNSNSTPIHRALPPRALIDKRQSFMPTSSKVELTLQPSRPTSANSPFPSPASPRPLNRLRADSIDIMFSPPLKPSALGFHNSLGVTPLFSPQPKATQSTSTPSNQGVTLYDPTDSRSTPFNRPPNEHRGVIGTKWKQSITQQQQQQRQQKQLQLQQQQQQQQQLQQQQQQHDNHPSIFTNSQSPTPASTTLPGNPTELTPEFRLAAAAEVGDTIDLTSSQPPTSFAQSHPNGRSLSGGNSSDRPSGSTGFMLAGDATSSHSNPTAVSILTSHNLNNSTSKSTDLLPHDPISTDPRPNSADKHFGGNQPALSPIFATAPLSRRTHSSSSVNSGSSLEDRFSLDDLAEDDCGAKEGYAATNHLPLTTVVSDSVDLAYPPYRNRKVSVETHEAELEFSLRFKLMSDSPDRDISTPTEQRLTPDMDPMEEDHGISTGTTSNNSKDAELSPFALQPPLTLAELTLNPTSASKHPYGEFESDLLNPLPSPIDLLPPNEYSFHDPEDSSDDHLPATLSNDNLRRKTMTKRHDVTYIDLSEAKYLLHRRVSAIKDQATKTLDQHVIFMQKYSEAFARCVLILVTYLKQSPPPAPHQPVQRIPTFAQATSVPPPQPTDKQTKNETKNNKDKPKDDLTNAALTTPTKTPTTATKDHKKKLGPITSIGEDEQLALSESQHRTNSNSDSHQTPDHSRQRDASMSSLTTVHSFSSHQPFSTDKSLRNLGYGSDNHTTGSAPAQTLPTSSTQLEGRVATSGRTSILTMISPESTLLCSFEDMFDSIISGPSQKKKIDQVQFSYGILKNGPDSAKMSRNNTPQLPLSAQASAYQKSRSSSVHAAPLMPLELGNLGARSAVNNTSGVLFPPLEPIIDEYSQELGLEFYNEEELASHTKSANNNMQNPPSQDHSTIPGLIVPSTQQPTPPIHPQPLVFPSSELVPIFASSSFNNNNNLSNSNGARLSQNNASPYYSSFTHSDPSAHYLPLSSSQGSSNSNNVIPQLHILQSPRLGRDPLGPLLHQSLNNSNSSPYPHPTSPNNLPFPDTNHSNSANYSVPISADPSFTPILRTSCDPSRLSGSQRISGDNDNLLTDQLVLHIPNNNSSDWANDQHGNTPTGAGATPTLVLTPMAQKLTIPQSPSRLNSPHDHSSSSSHDRQTLSPIAAAPFSDPPQLQKDHQTEFKLRPSHQQQQPIQVTPAPRRGCRRRSGSGIGAPPRCRC